MSFNDRWDNETEPSNEEAVMLKNVTYYLITCLAVT